MYALRCLGLSAFSQQVGGRQPEQIPQSRLKDTGTGRLCDRGEHCQPVGDRRRVEGRARTMPGGGQPSGVQISCQRQAAVTGAGEDRDVLRADPAFPVLAADACSGQQRPHVSHHVPGDGTIRVVSGSGAVAA